MTKLDDLKKLREGLLDSKEVDSPVDKLKHKKSFIQKFTMRLKERKSPDKIVMVNIELLNGMHRTFLVNEKDGSFKYKGKIYIFDTESKYYIIDSSIWSYDFHETYVLPVKREIPIDKMKKVMESAKIDDVIYASNPKTLESFINAKLGQGMMKAKALDEAIRRMNLMMMINLIATIGLLLLFAWKTGMLEQIQLPI